MKRSTVTKKLCATLLCVVLVVGLWPGAVAAATQDEPNVAASISPLNASAAAEATLQDTAANGSDSQLADTQSNARASESPALDYAGYQSDMIVQVNAPVGAFPAGTTVQVSPADARELMNASDALLQGTAVDARAVDISFMFEGAEVQPAQGYQVAVSLRPWFALEGDSFSAVHLTHEGEAEIVGNATAKGAQFQAESFSIYGIVGENAVKRVQVTFKSGGATLSTQIVRDGDTLVAPDPTPAQQQQTLYYWEVGSTQLASTLLGTPLSLADINALINDYGAEPLEGDNIWGFTATAKFDSGYRAYFHKNARGAELAEIVADSLETDASKSVNLSKASFVAPDSSLKLTGWEEYSSEGTLLNTYSTTQTITLSRDVHLYPVLASGQWVSLDLSPAATQPNVFAPLIEGETGQWKISFADLPTAESLGESYYQGYTFGGWYLGRTGTSIDDYEYTNPITEDITVTTTSTTLYAKWEPAAVAYSVVHWVEGPERGPGEGDYTYYSTEAKSGTVGTEIPVAQNDEIDTDAGGYHVAGTDELGNGGTLNEQVVTITRDGAAVKNVYHNRNRVKPTFKKLNNGAVLDPQMDERYEGYIKWGEGPDYWDPNRVIDGYLESGHSGNTYYLFGGGNVLGKTTNFSNERGWTYEYPYYPLFSLPDKTAFTYSSTTTWTARSVTQDRFYFEAIEGEAGPDDIEITFGGQTLTLAINPDRTFNENSSIASSEWAISKNPNTTKFLFEGFSKWAYRHGVSRTNHNPTVDAFLATTANVRAYLGDDGLRHIDWFYARNRYTLSYANIDGVVWPAGRTQPEAQVVQYGASLASYDPGLTEGTLRSVGGKTYTFLGWYRDAGAAANPSDPQSETRRLNFATDTMDKDTVAYAAWQPVSYSFSFNSNGGTAIPSTTVESGDRVEAPSAPTKTDATFVGWYKDEACSIPWDFYTDRVTNNTTVHAKWISGQVCALTYRKAGGDPVASDVTSYYSGTRVKLDAAPDDPSQTGSFLGWSTAQGDATALVPNTFTIYQNTNLFAVYGDAPEAAGPVVTLNSNYPAPATQQTHDLTTVRVNDQVGIPGVPAGDIAAPRGYRFVEWNTAVDGSGDSYQPNTPVGVASATALYAQWEPLKIATPVLTETYRYDGTQHKPEPLVETEDHELLQKNVDYTLSYQRNVQSTSADDMAKVIITPTETGKVWLADPVTLPFSIDKVSLTVTALPATIQYGDEPTNNGVSYSGFVEGEDERVLTGQLQFSYEPKRSLTMTAQAAPIAAGLYNIVPSGLTGVNYDVQFAPGTLTVEPRQLQLTWTHDLVYNGTNQSYGGATTADIVEGDDVYVATYDGITAGTNVDAYAARAVSLGGVQASNYTLPSDTSYTWHILKAPNSVSAPDITGWAVGAYDAAVNSPTSAANFYAAGEPTYEYKLLNADDSAYTTKVPTAEGRYVVRALVADTQNYEGAVSEPTVFEITKAEGVVPTANESPAADEPQTKPDRTVKPQASVLPGTGDSLPGLPYLMIVLALIALISALTGARALRALRD